MIGVHIARGVSAGVGGLAEHVEAVSPALRGGGSGAGQGLLDRAAHHELAGQDTHALAQRSLDQRLANPPQHALDRPRHAGVLCRVERQDAPG